MAVENKYVNSDVAANNRVKPGIGGSAQNQILVVTFEVAAADSDGSIYRVFKDVPSNLIPYSATIMCDAITAGTQYSYGVYDPLSRGGALVDIDTFALNLDLSSASRTIDGMAAVNIDSLGTKSIAELLALTDGTAKSTYDLALTATTVGTAAGTITVITKFLMG